MANNEPMIALEADPNDPEDFDVTEAELEAALEARRRRGGRPAGSNKEQIALRVDKDVLEHFRATGPGWQSRMIDALRAVAGV